MTSGPPWRAALVDLDGVLLDTESGVLDLWRELFSRRRRPPPPTAGLASMVVGVSPARSVRLLFPDLPDDESAAVLREVAELEVGLTGRPIGPAVDLVRRIAAAGVPVGLVTGASRRRASAAVAALGLEDAIAVAVVWGEVPGKPGPDPYRAAAARLGLAPEDCLAIEDAASGVISAASAGCHVVGVLPPGRPDPFGRELARAGAHRVVRHLTAATLLPRDGGFDLALPETLVVPADAGTAGTAERPEGKSLTW